MKVFAMALLITLTHLSPAKAQIDRMFNGGPFTDFVKYSDELIKYAEDEERDKAILASEDLDKRAMQGIQKLVYGLDDKLERGGLTKLAESVNEFYASLMQLSGPRAALHQKLMSVGQSYSSELSRFVSARNKVIENSKKLTEALEKTKQTLRLACTNCIR